MPATPAQLTPEALTFLTERHLATLSTIRADGTVHVTAVGFTWDPEAGVARVITDAGSQKARNARDGVPAALCQIDGPRWLTVEGIARTSTDPAVIDDAVERYAGRYRVPRVNPTRVAIEIAVTRVLGSSKLIAR